MSIELVEEGEVKATYKIPKYLHKGFKHMATDEDVKIEELVATAMKDYLVKKGRLKR